MTERESETTIRRLTSADISQFEALMTLFGKEFDETDTYTSARPGSAYVKQLLDTNTFILLAAIANGAVVGGLAAYELQKFEQQRSEIYIYDLAVDNEHRRRGIATALIEEIRSIGRLCGAWVIFVQADQGDTGPISLYSKLGTAESVLHFDIDTAPRET